MEKFEEAIKLTDEVEKETQKAKDDEKANEVVSGEKRVYLNNLGTILFKMPGVELSLEGDKKYAEFKSNALIEGKLLTEAQLKAIYRQPTIVKKGGKDITVGGEWTDEEDNNMESIPLEIEQMIENFKFLRGKIQEAEASILALKGKKKKDQEEKKQKWLAEASDIFKKISYKRLDLLQLQQKRVLLFSSSLEEQANLDRIKLFAPQCILKNDGTPLWNSLDDMLNGDYDCLKLLGIFSMFIRGVDISFFADTPVEQILS